MIFTPEELALLGDRQIFLRKRSLMEKIEAVFARTEQLLKDTAINSQFSFPQDCHLRAGKISRGENLEGHPWMVLDHPRYIRKDDILLFRTLCWLGHGFSFSLIASGQYLHLLQGRPLPEGWTAAADTYIWQQSTADDIKRFPTDARKALRMTRWLTNDPVNLEKNVLEAFNSCLQVLSK